MAAADSDLDSGLFNIALSDSEGEEDGGGGGGAATETVRDRTGQTEEQFQAVKRAYRPKVDNGEVSFFLGWGLEPHPLQRASLAGAVFQKDGQKENPKLT